MSVLLGIITAIIIWVLFGWFWGGLAALVHYQWGPPKAVNGDDAVEFVGFTAMLGPLAFIVLIVFGAGAIKNQLLKGQDPYNVQLYKTKEWQRMKDKNNR